MNKEAFIKYACDELIHKGNLDIIKTVFSEDYIAHTGEKTYIGHDFLKRWVKQFHTAMHNVKVSKMQWLSKDNEKVTWQRTLTGLHKQALRGIPASRKKVTWTEMVVSHFEADKNELPRCKHTRYQVPKKQNSKFQKNGRHDASIGELNPKRLKKNELFLN